MTKDQMNNHFGRHLRSLRDEKGYSLEDISSETRISRQVLQNIEEEAHDRLPDPAFVKGFLRTYAAVVDADAIKTIESYMVNLNDYRKTSAAAGMKVRSGPQFWLNVMIGLGALAIIIGGSIFMIPDTQESLPLQKDKPSITLEKKATTATAGTTEENPPNAAEKNASEKWLLAITGLEETWLKIIIDGQEPHEYTLKAEELLELEAASYFNILIGNATGVRIRLNEKPVSLSGKSGQVVTLRLP